MFIQNGVSVLDGRDITKDYCKIHAQYFKGPECRMCEEEGVKMAALAVQADNLDEHRIVK